jgi:hypothetical protein
MIDENYAKIMECSERLVCLVDVITELNNLCFDFTNSICDLDSDDEKLRTNAYYLVKNQPKLNVLHLLVGEQISSLEEISNILSQEADKFYFRKTS